MQLSAKFKKILYTGCLLKITGLYPELSLGYPKDTKFYLDSKASFIDISSILHLSCFWLLGSGNIALFRTVLCLA